MKEDQKQQELMFKLQMYEQHMNQNQQQLGAVDQGIAELGELIKGIEDLKGKKDQEILAQIGKGIFVKAKLISEDLVVDIGNQNLVGKDIESTTNLIKEQLGKLEEAKKELSKNFEQVQSEMGKMLEEFQATQEGHVHGPDCDHHNH